MRKKKMSPSHFTSDGITFNNGDCAAEIKAIFWPHIRAKGHFIVVLPYVRPQESDGGMLPDTLRNEDVHHSVAARIVDIGPIAYTDQEISGGVSWCEIGDWVFIPRVAGTRVALRNTDGSDTVLRIVRENDIIATIKDPSEWEIRINATKY
jgi:co-chaperonin GroES (HSP10)